MSRLNDLPFTSRRSAVLAPTAMVSCEQPPAANIGIDILKRGGNAADAAVAVAATLNLTSPCSAGLGGDAFVLFYDAKTKKVSGLNGSGRSPNALSLNKAKEDGFNENNHFPTHHGHTVTVPGACAAWVDTVTKFGSAKLSLQEILQPAISLAEKGTPIPQIVAYFWNKGSPLLKDPNNKYGKDMLINGQAPKWGQIFKNPNLASTLKSIAKDGKEGFYKGRIAHAISSVVKEHGGVMTEEDLAQHVSTYEDPISVEYKGKRLWEIPPSTQGIVALMALSILRNIDVKAMGHNSAEYLHTLIEAVRLSFKDALTYVADPSVSKVPIQEMIANSQGEKRSKLINPNKAIPTSDLKESEGLTGSSDTTYFSVVDSEGNACSFIYSNYMGFGTGIVPEGCGFTLQNRGFGFSLKADHPNVLEPNKRPYHTIIPAMITDDKTGDLLSSYGVMGGFMQPQGHLQVLLNMVDFHMNPQEALDAARFCVGPGHEGPVGAISFEAGISESVLSKLSEKGHDVKGPVTGHQRALFGRGQVITRGAWWRDEDEGVDIADEKTVWWAGSDPRADGMALGY